MDRVEDDLICLVDTCDKIGIYSQTHGMAITLVGTVAGCGLKNYQFFHHIKSTVGISGDRLPLEQFLRYPVVLLFDLFYSCQNA